MADVLSQVLPVASALAGAGLAVIGSFMVERRKSRQAERFALATRMLDTFGRLIEAVTELGRTLRTLAEQLTAPPGKALHEDWVNVVKNVNDLVGEVRRSTALARLVAPAKVVSVIEQIEQKLAPLQLALLNAPHDDDAVEAALIEPGRGLLALRDQLVAELRKVQPLPWR